MLKNRIKTKYWVLISILCFLFLLVFLVPHKLVKKSGPYSYAVYDKNGILIGASVASDEQWRFEPGIVPEKFAKAIVAYEDKRFYKHLGVDFISIARAVVYNHKAGRIVSGGSTITMQTVRILEHNPKRTIPQKIHEAFVSVLLELRYSKKKILQIYSGCAPFGGNVVGLEAASWRYFHRSPEDLTWAEHQNTEEFKQLEQSTYLFEGIVVALEEIYGAVEEKAALLGRRQLQNPLGPAPVVLRPPDINLGPLHALRQNKRLRIAGQGTGVVIHLRQAAQIRSGPDAVIPKRLNRALRKTAGRFTPDEHAKPRHAAILRWISAQIPGIAESFYVEPSGAQHAAFPFRRYF